MLAFEIVDCAANERPAGGSIDRRARRSAVDRTVREIARRRCVRSARRAEPPPCPVAPVSRPEPSCATSDFPACWRSARRKPSRGDSSECKWLSRPCACARLRSPRVRRTSVPRNRRARSICDDRRRPSYIELVLLAAA